MTAKLQLILLSQPARNRSGSSLGLVACAAAVVFVGLVGLLVLGGRSSASPSSAKGARLVLMAAAGLREPVEEIVTEYGREHGVHIDIQFGGSNSLLNQLQVDRINTPDLFLAADQSYTRLAVESGLARETFAVATQRPVVIVRRDAAVKIETLDDLFVGGLRVSLGDPEQAAIGRTVRASLHGLSGSDSDRWQQFEQQVARWGVFKPTVNDVANDVQIGAVDAGIVWNTTVSSPAYQRTLKVIELPELSSRPEQVTLALLNSSQQPEGARKFARYLTAHDRGSKIFSLHGFGAVQADNEIRRESEPAGLSEPRRWAHQEDGSQ